MTLRRITPLVTALALAVTVAPAANAARPMPLQQSAATKAKLRAVFGQDAQVRAVFRPTAHSVDILFLRVERVRS
jgi:hypothetical protein